MDNPNSRLQIDQGVTIAVASLGQIAELTVSLRRLLSDSQRRRALEVIRHVIDLELFELECEGLLA